MTFVGKILVIIILAFSLFFLALSTVVFTTTENWKDATTKRDAQVKELGKQLDTAKAQSEASLKSLDTAKTDHATQVKQLEARIKDLTDENTTRQGEITQNRATLETAQENAKSALAEAKARTEETDVLRNTLAAVQKQANDFKGEQLELKDQIRILQREVEIANNNLKNLRERVTQYVTLLRQKGLSENVDQLKGGVGVAPEVEGEVKRVDDRNSRVEISIGSDDGLVVGHELTIYRTEPRPEYIGKIRIESVDPDQAVGRVIGTTDKGKKIKEGDHVSTTVGRRG